MTATRPSRSPTSSAHHAAVVVLGVVWLYLIFIYITLDFSLPLIHYGYSSSLQHLGYNPSASAFSLTVSTTISDLTILKFIFLNNKI
jgi:hypothetical protein